MTCEGTEVISSFLGKPTIVKRRDLSEENYIFIPVLIIYFSFQVCEPVA